MKTPVAAAPDRALHAEPVMGTVFTLDIRNVPNGRTAPAPVEEAIAAAVARLHWVDATFSTYKTDSEVVRFDRGDLGAAQCSPELRHVISLCHKFSKLTNGYFDAWATGGFDPSGVVKGWAAQEASLFLARHGYPDHIVDGGGDIVLSGRPAAGERWKVGLRHPSASGALFGVLRTGEGAVATSGTYERGRHVLDPFTRRPAHDLVSVTVVGLDLVAADAFATAALAMGSLAPEWLSSLAGYEAQVISSSGRGWSSAGFGDLLVPLARPN